MDDFDIITNNPAVAGAYPELTKFYQVGVLDIYTIARDMVHVGKKILSHPLSGSIKPWETCYKSIMMSRSIGKLDFVSLDYIENAIGMMNGRSTCFRVYTSEILEDFSVIDLDLIKSAMKVSDTPKNGASA